MVPLITLSHRPGSRDNKEEDAMTVQHTTEAKITVQGKIYTYWMDFDAWCMYARNKAGKVRMISRRSYLKDEASVQHAIAESFGLKASHK